jgi:hypothetical protein
MRNRDNKEEKGRKAKATVNENEVKRGKLQMEEMKAIRVNKSYR